MPSRRWLAVVLLAVVAAGCSREPHKSAQRRSQQEKTLWQTFMEEQSAAHPLKLAVPKAEDQAFGEEPRDIDQKDPRYWELSFGDHAVDPALFRERVTIFSRQYPGLVGFDEARTNVANDLYLEFLTERFWGEHPDLLSASALDEAVAQVKARLPRAAVDALVKGAPPETKQSSPNLMSGASPSPTPVAPGMANPTFTTATVVGGKPPPTPDPATGVLTFAKDKIPPEVLAGLDNVELSGDAIVVRFNVYPSEAAFDRHLRAMQLRRLVMRRYQEKYEPEVLEAMTVDEDPRVRVLTASQPVDDLPDDPEGEGTGAP